MGHATEIDGHAFCQGLRSMDLSYLDNDTQTRVRSAIYLVTSATIRPKYALRASERFSLDILTLGELIDIYHTREATDRRDKVYAMLGMSTDKSPSIVPDYRMPWSNIFCQLVRSLLPEAVDISCRDADEIAIIRSRARVLGIIRSIQSGNGWDNTRTVMVDLLELPGFQKAWSGHWTVEAPANHIRKEDVICLLQGALHPSIIRMHENYCTIIAIAICPSGHERYGYSSEEKGDFGKITSVGENANVREAETETDSESCSNTFADKIDPNFEVHLVWNWEDSHVAAETEDEFGCFLRSRALTYVAPAGGNLRTSMGRLFLSLQYITEAIGQFHLAIEAYEQASQIHSPNAITALDCLAWAYKARGEWKDVERAEGIEAMADLVGQQGGFTDVSEKLIIRLASVFDEKPMEFLLDARGGQATMTENIVEAAAGNINCAKQMMELLLNRKGHQVFVTEKVLKAAAGNQGHGDAVIHLLLKRRAEQVVVTEDIFAAATERSMMVLLEWEGCHLTLTERVISSILSMLKGRYEEEMLKPPGILGYSWRRSAAFNAKQDLEGVRAAVLRTLLVRYGGQGLVTRDFVNVVEREVSAATKQKRSEDYSRMLEEAFAAGATEGMFMT